ncbi:hypothetical protein DSO57_1005203 [Entomophthora muscae]|uniref:Uncharacterized protein n=1 Tax=Entomophthora muscae TaxID=34485 RepID=A0ACC2T7S7_9FUNG|nr:hypothetical protein DSO57_1005203 [Entomophthora muscae]
MGFSPSALVFGSSDGLTGVEQGRLQSTVPRKPPLVTTPSLSQWRAKDCNIEQEQIKGGLNTSRQDNAYNNHMYQLEDTQENTKTLHHDCLCPCHAIPAQNLVEDLKILACFFIILV